jgi:hypothetical protein
MRPAVVSSETLELLPAVAQHHPCLEETPQVAKALLALVMQALPMRPPVVAQASALAAKLSPEVVQRNHCSVVPAAKHLSPRNRLHLANLLAMDFLAPVPQKLEVVCSVAQPRPLPLLRLEDLCSATIQPPLLDLHLQ